MARKHHRNYASGENKESSSGSVRVFKPLTASDPPGIHRLQRTIGNRATQHLLTAPPQNTAHIQRFGLWDTLSEAWDTATNVAKNIGQNFPTTPSEQSGNTPADVPAAPLPDGDVRTVIDPDARVRTPEFKNTGFVFKLGSKVIVSGSKKSGGKRYLLAEEILPPDMISAPMRGWTLADNLSAGTSTSTTTENTAGNTAGNAESDKKATPKIKVPEVLSPDDIPGLPPKPNIEQPAFTEIIAELERMEKNPVGVESTHNEETGDARDTRVKDLAKVRASIAALTAETLGVTDAEVKDAQAYLYRRLAPLAPYYNQIANTNMLEQFVLENVEDENGKKQKVPKKDEDGNYVMNPGWMRTCNVTVPAMVVEGIGKTKDDYAGDVALLQRIFKLLEGKYKARKSYDAVSEFDALRLPDFMTLVAISFQMPDGAAGLDDDKFTEALKTARQEAANQTTLHSIMIRLIKAFSAKTENGQLHLSELQKIGTARRGYLWKQFRNQKITDKDQKKYDSVDADALLDVDTYRQAVQEKVNPILDSGGQVLVAMENHFVRLDAMGDEHVMVDDPGDRGFKNLVVTWEQARDLGFFQRYWKVTG